MTIDQLIHLIRNGQGTRDTILRDKANAIVNSITHAYDMHLVTCDCGQIHSFLPDSTDEHTCSCGIHFTSNEAPDLFF